jgi:hypothetical protein
MKAMSTQSRHTSTQHNNHSRRPTAAPIKEFRTNANPGIDVLKHQTALWDLAFLGFALDRDGIVWAGASGRTSLKVRTGAQCGKILVQEPCGVPLTSRIQQSIVGSHATATVGPSFFAATAADWGVRMIESDKGGTSNLYNPENAWTDASGALHVQIKKKSGRWSCAEIFLNRRFGYDTAHSCELNA